MKDDYIVIYAVVPKYIYETKELTPEDKLIAEREEDYKIFEDTNNSSQKLDAHNDVKFEDEQIAYINKLLGERGKTR